MNKRFISAFAAAALSAASFANAFAAETVTVPGAVLYRQDFEGDTEADITTKIGASSAFSLAVEEELGNKALRINGYGSYGYNKFGPEYEDAIVKMDVKQLGASGANGAYIGVGLRAARQSGGAYFSNMGVYFDSIRYDSETGKYDTAADVLRDRPAIVKTAGADYAKFASYDAMGDEMGILQKKQIFSSAQAKAYERNFNDSYYRIQASLIGSDMTNTVKTAAGETVGSVSAAVSPVSNTGKGVTQLQAHSGIYLVDNIKIMSPITLSAFEVSAEAENAVLGSDVRFTLSGGGIELQPDTARYEYDPMAVNIDFVNGTAAPLKTGTHTVKVFLDDINGGASLASSFSITGIDSAQKVEVVIDNPNTEYGGSVGVNVYCGGRDVTDMTVFSGDVDYADGQLTPRAAGLTEVTASYGGQSVRVPIAVNNSEEKLVQQDETPVFAEDFEGDAAQLTEFYANGNAGISVQNAANTTTNTESKALYFNNIQASSALFGPQDLTDYVLEYDFWCPTPKGSSASFLGATMRANSGNGGYKVGYVPVMKFNAQTHKVDTASTTTFNRQLTAAYGASNGIDKWYFGGFSGSSLQSSVMTGYWFTQKSVISDDTVTTELIRRDNGAKMASYTTAMSSLEGASESGATALSASQNVVYFDNVKIYRINKYSDIAVKLTPTGSGAAVTAAGVDAAGEHELAGDVKIEATGAVTLNGNIYTEGTGVGYVTVCCTDGSATSKYKVIRTGNPSSDSEATEFALVNPPVIYDENGNELAAITSEKPVYAQADVKRLALGGNGVMMIVAVYDFETDALVSVELTSADAVQRVGESFRLYKKLILPEDKNGTLYAKAMLIGTDLKPIAPYFEV